MKRGGRLGRKAHPVASGEQPPGTYFQSRNNSLPHLRADESSDFELQADLTVNRTSSIEGVAAEQSTRSYSRQVTRTIYGGKGKLKGENMVKQGSTAIGRTGSHSDISTPQLGAKRHKRTGMSMQFESDSVSAPGKTETAGKHLKGAKYVFSSTHGKWGNLPSRSYTPDLTSNPTDEDVSSLQAAFLKAIASIKRDDFKAQMKIYHFHFSKIIQTSGPLSDLLSLFQQGYEALFQDLQEKYTSEVTKLQNEIIHLQSAILREADDRKSLLSKIEKLSRENVEISETCQSYEEKLTDYQEKLYDIANVRMDFYPPTQQAWKVLNSELEYYHGWKKNAERELKISQAKEKKLVKLMHALKSRGYPVEEIYKTEVKVSAHRVQSAEGPAVRDENESQRLVSGRPKSLPKPQTVPDLQLEGVEPDLSSEEVSVDVPSAELSLGRTLSGLSTRFLADDLSSIHPNSEHQKYL